MANFPGTFEVRFFYVTNEPAAIASHEFRLSCEMAVEGAPGDPFTAWTPISKDGSATATLDSYVDSLVTLIQPQFNTAVDIVGAELWEYSPGTYDSIFRSAYTIGENGTDAGATVDFSQLIFVWRSQLGGIMKLDLRGTVDSPLARQAYPTALAKWNNLLSALDDADTIWHARDQGYPVIPLSVLPGSNERAFKEVNR